MKRLRAILSSYVGVVVFAVPIFLGAGRVAFAPGLRYLLVALVGTTLNHALMPAGSTLIEERAARARDGQSWDKTLLGSLFLLNLITFGAAGVDVGRVNAARVTPIGITVAGVVTMLAGQLLFALAKRVNVAFTSTVRILDDRPHPVCDRGPYRWVRHPGYLGMLLSLLAFPAVLGSPWAVAPTLLGAGLLVARTRLEDQFLHVNLPGYDTYARQVRWRLLPGVF